MTSTSPLAWPTPWTIHSDRCVLLGHVVAHTADEAVQQLCAPKDDQPESVEFVSQDDSYGHTFRVHYGPSRFDGPKYAHYVILYVKATTEYPNGKAPRAARPVPPPMPDLFA